jgi:hypothetical protein
MGMTTTLSSWSKWALAGTFMFLLTSSACAQSHVAWVADFDEALKQATEKKQFIVLDISASW